MKISNCFIIWNILDVAFTRKISFYHHVFIGLDGCKTLACYIDRALRREVNIYQLWTFCEVNMLYMDLLGLYWPRTMDLLGLYWPRKKSWGQYNPNRSIYNILTELKVLKFYIPYLFQYYYLNIKILKFYQNWIFWKKKIIFKSYENFEMKTKFWIFEILKFVENFEILNFKKNFFFRNFEMLWNFMKTEIFQFWTLNCFYFRILKNLKFYEIFQYW